MHYRGTTAADGLSPLHAGSANMHSVTTHLGVAGRPDPGLTMPEQPKSKPPRKDEIDEASEESFPASDPPANQPIHPGAPADHPDHKKPATKSSG